MGDEFEVGSSGELRWIVLYGKAAIGDGAWFQPFWDVLYEKYGPFTRIEDEPASLAPLMKPEDREAIAKRTVESCLQGMEARIRADERAADLFNKLTNTAIERHVHAPLLCETCQKPREYVSTDRCKTCLEAAGKRAKTYDPGEHVEECRHRLEFSRRFGRTDLQDAQFFSRVFEAESERRAAREAGPAHFSWRFGAGLDGGRR